MTRAKRPPDFEKSLAELEALVERLESGDLPLEESLKAFERGVTLTRECQSALEAAQARVEILTRSQGGEARLTPFESDEDDEELEDTEDGSSRNG
jgi:exodeoxyribonuclease VII small subunit